MLYHIVLHASPFVAMTIGLFILFSIWKKIDPKVFRLVLVLLVVIQSFCLGVLSVHRFH